MNTLESLFGILLLANQPQDMTSIHQPELELTPDSVIIKATSHGCTQKRHFRLIQNANQEFRVQRIKQDRCHQPAQLVEFHYSYQQLGLNRPIEPLGPRVAVND